MDQKTLKGIETWPEKESSNAIIRRFERETGDVCKSEWHQTVEVLMYAHCSEYFLNKTPRLKADLMIMMRRWPALELRSVRNNRGSSGDSDNTEVPTWYLAYIKTDHFANVKARASKRWSDFLDGKVRCMFNSRHKHEAWHHCDYGRLGCDDEHLYLVPYCNKCHEKNRICGPGLPEQPPKQVETILMD